jgi:3-methylcrotonyl-CoA carboxylase beta subunit
MAAISSRVDVHSEEFRANQQAMSELAADVRRQAARVALGGTAAAVKKHKAAGKLTARGFHSSRHTGCMEARSPRAAS